jgi:hypothetical protein
MANYGGFSPKRSIYSRNYTAGINVYTVPATDGTAIFVGDLVTAVGTSEVFNDASVQDVAQSATGDVFQGVVVGVHADTRDSLLYRVASTFRALYVCDDPDVLFEVPTLDTGVAIALNDLGLNANVSVGAGNTTTGLSAMQINTTGTATTNTLDLKLVGFENRPDNVVGTTSKWLVRLNRHRFANQVAGV